MWKRARWHECAEELDQVCRSFRSAYWGRRSSSWPRHPDDVAEMQRSSIEGIKILRALALAIRSEQDFDLIPSSLAVVGILKKKDAQDNDAIQVKHSCGDGYRCLLGKKDYVPLKLRPALNKIAHADPSSADFYISTDNDTHELLLYGENHGEKWFAAISIFDLIKAIKSLPDASIES